MNFNQILLRIRKHSELIRRNSTEIKNLLPNRTETDILISKIYQTHSLIWAMTGQILYTLIKYKRSRDWITITPGKSVTLIDTLVDSTPSWTEIMERIGPEIPERNSHIKEKSLNFNYVKIRKLLKYDHLGRCTNAFKLASSPDFLKLGYDIIKSKPGNMVRGSDHQTLDGISTTWFEKTSKLLNRECYTFKPARRVYIPKPNGKKDLWVFPLP